MATLTTALEPVIYFGVQRRSSESEQRLENWLQKPILYQGTTGAPSESRAEIGSKNQGFYRLRKKPERKANSAKDGLAGAKARLILLALSARLLIAA